LLELAGQGEADLRYEAFLRLAAIAVHQGRGSEAENWYRKADSLSLPLSLPSLRIERLTGLAGAAIDGFKPRLAQRFLEEPRARRALEDAEEPWEHIQVLGAWRRLHLLEGRPEEAREMQRRLMAVVDSVETPRAYLDLGFVELRCGDLKAAGRALGEARSRISALPPVYRLQSEAFLSWHAARLGAFPGLEELLVPATIAEKLGASELQEAGRWRLRAVKAVVEGDLGALQALAADLQPFQRWYLGVFLLPRTATRELAMEIFKTSDLDLSEMPVLEQARAEARAGRGDASVFLRFAAY
jgi:tetratricopeptide (TPR) repeat protein